MSDIMGTSAGREGGKGCNRVCNTSTLFCFNPMVWGYICDTQTFNTVEHIPPENTERGFTQTN